MLTAVTGRPSACLQAVFRTAVAIDSSCIALQFCDRLEHDIGRARDRTADAVAQPEPDVLDDLRLARNDENTPRPATDVLDEPQDGLRVHPVRIEHLAVLDLAVDIL